MEPAAVKRLRDELDCLHAARRAAEARAQTLADSEARYRAMAQREFAALAENAPDVICRFDRQFRHLYVNPAIERATGIPPQQLIGKTQRQGGLAEHLWEAWEARLQEVFEQKTEAQLEFRHPSPGGERHYEARFAPEFAPNGEVESVMVIARDITDLKRAQDARQQLTAILEATPDLVGTATKDGRLLYLNRAGRHMLGVSEKASLSGWTLSAVHPDWAYQRILAEGIPAAVRQGSWSGETAVLNRLGQETPISQVILAHKGPDDSLEYLSTIARDITRRKQAEEALRASEERYRFLTESIPQSVWSCDPTGQCWDFNNRWFEYSGLTPAQSGGDGWTQVVHPEDRPRVFEQWMHAVATGQPFEIEARLRRAADGSYRWHLAQAVAMRDQDGRIIRWFGSFTDIDDLRRTGLERLRLASLVENSQDFIKVSQLDGSILFLNAGGRKLVGLDQDTPAPHIAEFLFPQDRPILVQSVIPTVLRQGRWTGEINFRHFKTGEPIAMLWDVFTINDPQSGKPLYIATVSRDIRERKRVEQERERLLKETRQAKEQAEAANRAKDHFLAVLSHELRTPLTPALARLAMLQNEPRLTGSMREGLALIRRNIELEAQLINDLLDLTRIVRGKLELHPETVDAHANIQAAAEIFQREVNAKFLHLRLDLQAQHHHVRAEPSRLQQVFWNLLSNAVKYTPQHGSIVVRSTDQPNGLLKVQIIDTGIGIEPETMKRLFTAFEQGEQTLTRRFGGLGLGLSISQTLVRLHGGRLSAASAGKDQGATFTVELPTVAPPAPLSRPAPPPAHKMDHRALRILLVEDNADTLRVMARLLKSFGHRVTAAASIGQALDAAKEPFDLIISDIGLPDGTGWDLMRSLHERQPVPGIALSGFASEEDAKKSLGAGFVEHLAKPIDPERLEQAIQQVAASSGR